jgi:hypothetical protein
MLCVNRKKKAHKGIMMLDKNRADEAVTATELT